MKYKEAVLNRGPYKEITLSDKTIIKLGGGKLIIINTNCEHCFNLCRVTYYAIDKNVASTAGAKLLIYFNNSYIQYVLFNEDDIKKVKNLLF